MQINRPESKRVRPYNLPDVLPPHRSQSSGKSIYSAGGIFPSNSRGKSLNSGGSGRKPPSGPFNLGFGRANNDNNNRRDLSLLASKSKTFDKRRQTPYKAENKSNPAFDYGDNDNISNNNNNNNKGGKRMRRRKTGSNNDGGNKNYNNSTEFNSNDLIGGYGSSSSFSENNYSPSGGDFSAGIRSGFVLNSAQNATERWTPLIVQCGELFPPYSVTVNEDNYFNRVIFNDVFYEYLRVAQIRINRVLVNEFTLSKWYSYIYTITRALQVYYMYDSIAAYVSDTRNQNPAITDIYNSISPDAWVQLKYLEQNLSKSYIHPNMLSFIRFMYQNFKAGDGSSAIIRLSLDSSLSSSAPNFGFVSGDLVSEANQNLIDTNRLEINAYMSRAFPEWQITSLPASWIDPVFSKNFSTFFMNSSISFVGVGQSDIVYSKEVDDIDTNVPYFVYDDDVDGLFVSLNTIQLSSGTPFNGLWAPTTDLTQIVSSPSRCSLLTWKENRSLTPPTNIDASADVHNCFPVIYDVLDSNFRRIEQSYAFTQPVIHCSVSNMVQACNDAYRYLLYPSSVL